MDLKNVINKRRSVRKFNPAGHVDSYNLLETLKYAIKAPSAGGLKAYEYFFIGGKQVEEIAKATRQKWIAKAPVVIVLCAYPDKSGSRYGKRGEELYCIQDATLFGAYLDLLLVEKGYGTCWVGAFKEDRVKDFMKMPKGLRPISLLVVGVK